MNDPTSQTTPDEPDTWLATSVIYNSRMWTTDRLVRSFMRQGFGSDEAWRRARLLVEDGHE